MWAGVHRSSAADTASGSGSKGGVQSAAHRAARVLPGLGGLAMVGDHRVDRALQRRVAGPDPVAHPRERP